jgi:hypothetical protein
MYIKILIQSLFYGAIFLAIHFASHIWPVAAQHQEIKDLFGGPLVLVYYALNVLAFPFDLLFGWMWSTFDEFNAVGPFLAGFALTAYQIRKANAKGRSNANG